MSARNPPIAVIDLGSNSGRVVVYDLDRGGYLRVRAVSRAALRLVHDVDDEDHDLSEESMAKVMEALRDFLAIAHGGDATRVVAIATAAMREAKNGPGFIARIRRELGIKVQIIDGALEADYGFRGALHGLPEDSGLLFDMGGGSMQVSRFKKRVRGRSTSLPLGALRLSETFLESDPPKAGEIRRLRAHVKSQLQEAKVHKLGRGEHLLGTGGTLRNLAKIDQRRHDYPIKRLHGYVISAAGLHEIAEELAQSTLEERDAIPGLSAERADSIVGGALGIETLLELVGAETITVSGQGVREGLVFSMLGQRAPSLEAVKETSLVSLTSRFDGWRPDVAERRRAVAATLLRRIVPKADRDTAETLDRAARILDIGRSIDFFDRYELASDIVLTTERNGYTHEEIALVAAVLRRAGNRRADLASLHPLVADDDERIEHAAVLLALADDIEERCPGDKPIRLSVKVDRAVVVRVPSMEAWRPRMLGPRFKKAFGKALEVLPGV